MSSDTYTIDVHSDAAREFQRLSDDARAFVRKNLTSRVEFEGPPADPRYDRPDDIPPKTRVFTFPNKGQDTFGISGVAVEIDYRNKKITITGLL